MKKNLTKNQHLWMRVGIVVLLLPALLAGVQNLSASAAGITLKTSVQQRAIKGKVVDEKGEPIPGVSVKLKETTTGGAITNKDGDYVIAVPGAGGVLVFEFIGLTPVEITLGLPNTVNVTMVPSVASLDEVVVVGYGTQKRSEITGAVSTLQAKDLIMSSSPDIGHLMKGKLSGLLVIEDSAQPGGGITLQIRGATSITGNNDPLIVVDGFPMTKADIPQNGGRYMTGSQSILNVLNPNDIESITVLKDAGATSIYGARASNGVILITTKPGVEGKPTVQYSVDASANIYNDEYDVFNLKEWMAEANRTNLESWDHTNGVIPWGTKTRAEAEAAPLNGLLPTYKYTQAQIDAAGPGTDWLGLITRNGYVQQHNLSLSGGTRSSRYFFSGNYYQNVGVVKNTDAVRYSIRTTFSQDLSQYVKLNLSLYANRNTNNGAPLGDAQFENSSLIRSAIDFSPAILAITPDGQYPLNPEQGLRPQPYSMLTITNKDKIDGLNGNLGLDILPIKDLKVTLSASANRTAASSYVYEPKTSFWGNLENGRANVAENINNRYTIQAQGTYTKSIAKVHNFTLIAGANQEMPVNTSMTEANTGFITDAFLYNNIGAGSGTKSLSTSYSKSKFVSMFGRLAYNYKSKYLLTYDGVRNGASAFADDHKWATFHSGSAAWNVDKERWFAGALPFVSHLKLRGSYGSTGNYSAITAFASYTAVPGYLSGADQIQTAVYLKQLANPDLKWETVNKANIGLDVNLFKDKVEVNVEVYKNVNKDLLQKKALSSYNFISSVQANIGTTQSHGWEVTVGTYNVTKENFQWKTSYRASHDMANWVERAPGTILKIYQSVTDPIFARYSQKSDGIMQLGEAVPVAQPLLQPGQVKIRDVDGYQRDAAGNPVVDANKNFILTGIPDGLIDDADTKLVGVTARHPMVAAGITNILSYKSLSLNFDINGQFGRYFADPNYAAFGRTPSSTSNTLKTVTERWTPTNPSTSHPSAFGSNYGVGDFYDMSAWFLRMQNIELGYDLPKTVLKNLAQQVRIKVGALNLFKVTPYTGIDPETDASIAAYPNVHTYTLGISAKF